MRKAFPLTAHIGYLFTELPLLQRVEAAAAYGFSAIDISDPLRFPLGALKDAAVTAGIPFWQTTTSFSGSGPPAVGMAALAGLESPFAEDCEQILRAAKLIGARWVHVMAGCPQPEVEAGRTFDVYCENLRRASRLFGDHGIGVLVEQINAIDLPGYYVTELAQAIDILDHLADPNISVLFDTYNVSRSGLDLVRALALAKGHIGHVQLADAPGRHEPGTGTIEFSTFLEALSASGYDGRVACEYHPLGESVAGLEWVRRLLSLPTSDRLKNVPD